MYNFMQYLANYGFTITDQLPDIVQKVNATDTLFFRLGKWGEDLEQVIIDQPIGNGLICLQDLVALGKHLQKNDVQPDDTLQIISGYTFKEKSTIPPLKTGERFVCKPTLVIETEVPNADSLRGLYVDILNNGGYTEKPEAAKVISEDDMRPIPEDKAVKHSATEEKQIAKRNENKESFESNWNNLLARKDRRDTHSKVDSKFAEEHPLSDNFKKWAEGNWTAINSKLNTHPSLYVTHERESIQDMLNRGINGKNTHINDLRVFPMNYPPQPKKERSSKELLAWIDGKIHEWNPRATLFTEPERDEDGEYVQPPEIIGDVNNPQSAGIDENGDDVYNDFDEAGHFVPMGNPNNETDYQKDFDPQEFRPENWNSIDEIDDHHTDEYFYKEVGVTETPQFDEEGTIDWKNAPHSDEQEIVAPESDQDFVRDARNWLQREHLIRESEDSIMRLQILSAYPVSQDFLKYLEDSEIDWEVANKRLKQLAGLRETAATDAIEKKVPINFVMPEPDYPDYY